MGWALSLAIYFVIWWVVLFAVLPFGVTGQREAAKRRRRRSGEGQRARAPIAPRLLYRVSRSTRSSRPSSGSRSNIYYIYFYLPSS